MDFLKEIEILTPLAQSLKKTKDLGEKQELLLNFTRVEKSISNGSLRPFLLSESGLWPKIAVLSLAAIGQDQIVLGHSMEGANREKIRSFLQMLTSIDRFYESIGGIVGYHLHILKLLVEEPIKEKNISFAKPQGIDVTQPSEKVLQAVYAGIQALPEIGEIYPIGGLGSRLDLKSKTGEPLPVALLPFLGRSLLEGLVRDVQGREFCYYRLFGKQVTVPIAMMTSQEKQNGAHILSYCIKKHWFGRPQESFQLFPQLSVPVLTKEGMWSMHAPFEPNLAPGGHGALWRTAEERGVFNWFQEQEKNHVVIRQINNPIGGLDGGLYALIGIGKQGDKAFGFASCQRLPHAAEGVLVAMEKEGETTLSNIEYTDFPKYGIEDKPEPDGFSPYPANTNILYANLRRILPQIKKSPLPGLILNMKAKVPYLTSDGRKEELVGGRLESMMQNLSDSLTSVAKEELPTFLTYNERRKTISAAKRKFGEDKKLLETPEGAFYDLLFNAYDLLKNYCGFELPSFSDSDIYLKEGPSLLFIYHPGLGPLYDIIAQKIQRGRIASGGELQLEIADILIRDLELEGSLLIEAENLLGHHSQDIVRYSQKTGKCVLKNVKVRNKGINRKVEQTYWKNTLKRQQSLKIFLEGQSEFYAENVTFTGNQSFSVPDGERWVVSQEGKEVRILKEKADWNWSYHFEKNKIKISADCPVGLADTSHKLS